MKHLYKNKEFVKHYDQRIKPNPKLVKRFDERIRLFVSGERGQPLNDHRLKGTKLGQRAFWIAGDIRVVYIETADSYIFVDIGSHNQVY